MFHIAEGLIQELSLARVMSSKSRSQLKSNLMEKIEAIALFCEQGGFFFLMACNVYQAVTFKRDRNPFTTPVL